MSIRVIHCFLLERKVVLLSIFFTLLFLPGAIFAQHEISFEHITCDEGLPENSVCEILQDYQGFLWFATQYGAVKYDGYKFTLYANNSADTSISPYAACSFYEDNSRRIYRYKENDIVKVVLVFKLTQSHRFWVGSKPVLFAFLRNLIIFTKFSQ